MDDSDSHSETAPALPETDGGELSRVCGDELTQATINHTHFPHIMDAILDHASSDVLMAFRLTCKAYANRCRRMLAEHLIINTSCAPMQFRSVRGALTPGREWNATRFQAAVQQHPDFFAHCRILDLLSSKWLYRHLKPILPRLDVLRTFSTEDDLYNDLKFPANTIVTFRGLPNHNQFNRMGPFFSLLFTANKLVINMTTSRRDVSPIGRSMQPLPVTILVLHFRLYSDKPHEPLLQYSVDWLGRNLGHFLELRPTATLIMVDLDSAPVPAPKLRGPQWEAWSSNKDAYIRDARADRNRHLVERVAPNADRLLFMTGAEYCAKYGAAQHDLETLEEPQFV